jgi:hypothetical protein
MNPAGSFVESCSSVDFYTGWLKRGIVIGGLNQRFRPELLQFGRIKCPLACDGRKFQPEKTDRHVTNENFRVKKPSVTRRTKFSE